MIPSAPPANAKLARGVFVAGKALVISKDSMQPVAIALPPVGAGQAASSPRNNLSVVPSKFSVSGEQADFVKLLVKEFRGPCAGVLFITPAVVNENA